MKCAAPIGFGMNLLALISGAIWGKPTWGTYWVWDARNTFFLILLFVYIAIMAIYDSYKNNEMADKLCAVLALVGLVNIPIIYKSVDWWYTLHQPATIKFTSESTMHASMLYPLLIVVVGFYCFYTLVLLLSLRNEILNREWRSKWVAKLVSEKKEQGKI